MKAGFVMNIMCIGVLTLAINTWGNALFNLDSFPEWADGKIVNGNNATAGNFTSHGNDTFSDFTFRC